ncbi:MAG TPA: T9SS type A sorting domain-containing protein [Flavipsychrobacter sp.]|nr:T9SS type A sorting domain-containing protein [Flavipsychrobacter sp.]
MKIRLLSTIMLAGSLMASAQPTIVKNINPNGDSNPMWLTGFGNKLVFIADDGVNGSELWAYDTAASLKYDLNPGSASSAMWTGNRHMAVNGGMVYFPADNGTTGTELYAWGGVDSIAPVLVSDIYPGISSSDISEVYSFGDRVYFNAYSPSFGNELWSYTVTTGYIQRLTDLAAGLTGSFPSNFIAYKDKLYFTANNGTNGYELFAYNPATNSTALVADVFTGIGGSYPQGYTIINNKMYFSAYTPSFGRELYSFDGTNIMRHTNVDNSGGDGVIQVNNGDVQFIALNNKIYFSGDDGSNGPQLYQFNPANGVASKVYDINPSGGSYPQYFTYYAGKIFFSADDGTHGYELWSYDGKGTPMLAADIDMNIGSAPMNLLRWGTNLYFSAYTQDSGNELYKLSDSAALNIQNTSFNAEVKVFPNPTANVTTIQINSKADLQLGYVITDITGKIVSRSDVKTYTSGTNNVTIDMTNLATGVYQYRLFDAAGVMMAGGNIQKL